MRPAMRRAGALATGFTAMLLASLVALSESRPRTVALRTGLVDLATWPPPGDTTSSDSSPEGSGSDDNADAAARSAAVGVDPTDLAYASADAWGEAPALRLYLMSYGDGADGPSGPALRSALLSGGANVLSYMGERTLLVAARAGVAEAVAQETGAGLAEYGPQHRVAPEWGPLLQAARVEASAGRRRLATGDAGAGGEPGEGSSAQPLWHQLRAWTRDALPVGPRGQSSAEAGGSAQGSRRRSAEADAEEQAPPLYELAVELLPGLPAAAVAAAEADWPRALAAALGRGDLLQPAAFDASCAPVVVAAVSQPLPAKRTRSAGGVPGQTADSPRASDGEADTRLRAFLCAEDLPGGVAWLASQPVSKWVAPRAQLRAFSNTVAAIVLQTGSLSWAEYDAPLPDGRLPYWRAGLIGTGEIIGVGDSGIDLDSCFLNDARFSTYRGALIGYPPYFYIPSHRKVVLYWVADGASWGDEIGHGTHVSGSLVGSLVAAPGSAVGAAQSAGVSPWPTSPYTGTAPGARLSIVDAGPTNTAYTRVGDLLIPQPADRYYLPVHLLVNASITSDSWGGLAQYDSTAREYDMFLWRNPGVASFVAAGNEGTQPGVLGGTVSSPATAKSTVAVGATHRVPLPAAGRNPGQVVLVARGLALNGTAGFQFVLWPNENLKGLPALSDILKRNEPMPLKVADPLNACKNLINPAGTLKGAVVLVSRGGGCDDYKKALAVVAAGGIAMIEINNAPGMLPDTTVPNPVLPGTSTYAASIPVSVVAQAVGNWLVGNISASASASLLFTALPATFNDVAFFSSYGMPTSGDGINTDSGPPGWRIKPDLMSPGVDVRSAFLRGVPSGGACFSSTANLTGTSMATPLAAGTAALARQYMRAGFYPTGSPSDAESAPFTPSGILLKAILIAGAASMEGGLAFGLGSQLGPPPDGYQGWGRLSLAGSLPLPGVTDPGMALQLVDGAQMTATGNVFEASGLTATGTGPVTVVLAWYDYPADVNSASQLVNDLDLEVEMSGAGGKVVLLGNNPPGAASPAPDRDNTVERVFIPAPASGAQLTVRVRAASIASKLLSGSDARLPQRFAVAVVGRVTGYLESPLNPAVAKRLAALPTDSPPPSPPQPPPPRRNRANTRAASGPASASPVAQVKQTTTEASGSAGGVCALPASSLDPATLLLDATYELQNGTLLAGDALRQAVAALRAAAASTPAPEQSSTAASAGDFYVLLPCTSQQPPSSSAPIPRGRGARRQPRR